MSTYEGRKYNKAGNPDLINATLDEITSIESIGQDGATFDFGPSPVGGYIVMMNETQFHPISDETLNRIVADWRATGRKIEDSGIVYE